MIKNVAVANDSNFSSRRAQLILVNDPRYLFPIGLKKIFLEAAESHLGRRHVRWYLASIRRLTRQRSMSPIAVVSRTDLASPLLRSVIFIGRSRDQTRFFDNVILAKFKVISFRYDAISCNRSVLQISSDRRISD